MSNPTEIFSEINARVEANPTKVAGLNAAYAFDLSGDDGGAFHITLADGSGTAGPGAPATPSVTISMSDTDFVAMATGKLDPTAAFMSGKLKLKGDMALAMKLQGILRD